MNLKQKIIAAILALLGVSGVAYSQLGGAGEIPANVVEVRNIVVGKTAATLLFEAATSTSAGCSSRVISNPNQPLVLKFATTAEAATIVPGKAKGEPALGAGVSGIIQAGSTTVSYDAIVYGCDYVGAWGQEASSSITVTEFK